MPKQLTRTELYELVWKRPVTKVAADLEISDVALHKICRKHSIPVPGRGHWAKLAAGKSVTRTRLPKENDSSLARIEIRGSATRLLPVAVRKAHDLAQSHKDSRTEEAVFASIQSPHIERLKKKMAS